MKKLFILCMLLLPAFTFAGCSNDENEPQTENSNDSGSNEDNNNQEPETPGNGKTLIAYFSRWGNTNYPDNVDASTGASIIINNGERVGTTEQIARYIQSVTKGDIHLIRTSSVYPTDFNEVRDQNHREQSAGALPELADEIEDMEEQYDIIFIGYPNWAMDIPRPVASFLSDYNFEGKTVIPFCTHDGYGAAGTFRSVAEAAAGAKVLDGFAVEASDVPNAESKVQQWLTGLGIDWDMSVDGNVTVKAGDHLFSATWRNTPLAKEIRGMFPLEVTLGRYAQREFYGSMPLRPTNTEEGQLEFKNGDITYCPSNNTIAIFYGQAENPDMGQLTMRVIPIGQITSELSVFNELDSRMNFIFENNQ